MKRAQGKRGAHNRFVPDRFSCSFHFSVFCCGAVPPSTCCFGLQVKEKAAAHTEYVVYSRSHERYIVSCAIDAHPTEKKLREKSFIFLSISLFERFAAAAAVPTGHRKKIITIKHRRTHIIRPKSNRNWITISSMNFIARNVCSLCARLCSESPPIVHGKNATWVFQME